MTRFHTDSKHIATWTQDRRKDEMIRNAIILSGMLWAVIILMLLFW